MFDTRSKVQHTQFRLIRNNLARFSPNRQYHWSKAYAKADLGKENMPSTVILELANTCVLDCVMCRVGQFGWNSKRIMPLSFFKELCDSLLPTAQRIRINGLGEASLIPDFMQYVDYIEKFPHLYKEIITNLMAGDEIYTGLIDRNYTILVSWDAVNPYLFEAIRRRSDYSLLLTRITNISKYWSENGQSNPMHLLFTMLESNIQELTGVFSLASDLNLTSVIVNMEKTSTSDWPNKNRIGQIRLEFTRASKITCKAGTVLNLPDQIAGETLDNSELCDNVRKTSSRGCNCPWSEVVIHYDGLVSPCNMFNSYKYGDLKCLPFKQVWNGRLAEVFRSMQNSELRHPECTECYYLQGVYRE